MAMRLRSEIATRFGLRGLNEAVDGLDEAVGNLGVEPSQNAVAMPLNCARDFLDRLEARSDGQKADEMASPAEPTRCPATAAESRQASRRWRCWQECGRC